MLMIDFNQYVQNQRMYGGTAGRNEAVKNITPNIAAAFPKIEKMILEITVLTDIQKKFYLAIMKERYEKVLKPVFQKIMRQQVEAKSH